MAKEKNRAETFLNQLLAAGLLVALSVPLLVELVRFGRPPNEIQHSGNRKFGFTQRVSRIGANLREDPAGSAIAKRLRATVQFNAFRSSPNSSVLLGKDQWLFYSSRVANTYYRRVVPMSATQVTNWDRFINGRRKRFERQGILYVMVIAPNKSSIYPDFMPKHLQQLAPESRLDQLLGGLRTENRLHVLDLRSTLRKARQEHQVYLPQDTHWNTRGAWIANLAIIDRLEELGIGKLRRPTVEATTSEYEGDLVRMMSAQESQPTELVQVAAPRAKPQALDVRILGAHAPRPNLPKSHWQYPTIFESNPSEAPRAVVFCDSFGSSLAPFLVESFSRALLIRRVPRASLGVQFSQPIDGHVVENEKPDVVIELFVERQLSLLAPDDGN